MTPWSSCKNAQDAVGGARGLKKLHDPEGIVGAGYDPRPSTLSYAESSLFLWFYVEESRCPLPLQEDLLVESKMETRDVYQQPPKKRQHYE